MPKRIRVYIALPSGANRYVALSEARKLITEERAVWIEEDVSARMIASSNHGCLDYSGQMGPRVKWTPRKSGGGATVLQLL